MRRRLVTGLALALTTSAIAVPSAGAHVSLVGSEPGDATSLTNVPRQVKLRFNEPLSARFRQVHLIDAHGHIVTGTRLRAATDPRELALQLPANLPRGAYEVTWEALSKNDGHVSGGALVFGAGASVGPVVRPAPATPARTPDALLRWAWIASVLALIGIVCMTLVLARAPFSRDGAEKLRSRTMSRLLVLIAPVAGAAAVAGLGLLAREVALVPGDAPPGQTLGHLLTERWGVLWGVGEALLLALAATGIAVRRSRRTQRSDRWIASSAVLLVALAAVHVASGHAAAQEHAVLLVTAGTVHFLAAGVWLGGVAALAVVLWPGSRATRTGSATIVRAVRRPFGILAGAALAVAVLTGLPAMGAQVASVDALLTTDYGQSLLAKGALMALAGLVGLVNALMLLRMGRSTPGGLRGRLPRLIAVEAALGAGALLAVAEMTASAPPRGPEFRAPRPVRAPVLARQVQDVLVSATARPNRVGTNVFTVTTASTRRGYGPPVQGVTLRLAPRAGGTGVAARSVALTSLGSSRWTGGAVLEGSGAWRMTVVVRRPGKQLVAPLTWKVEPADQVLPVRYSARRLAPITGRAALVLLAGLGFGLLGLAAIRHRPRGARPGASASRLRAVGRDTI